LGAIGLAFYYIAEVSRQPDPPPLLGKEFWSHFLGGMLIFVGLMWAAGTTVLGVFALLLRSPNEHKPDIRQEPRF
jgi:hypothetical protein